MIHVYLDSGRKSASHTALKNEQLDTTFAQHLHSVLLVRSIIQEGLLMTVLIQEGLLMTVRMVIIKLAIAYGTDGFNEYHNNLQWVRQCQQRLQMAW